MSDEVDFKSRNTLRKKILEQQALLDELKKKNSELAEQALATATESLMQEFGQEQAKVWKAHIEKPLLDLLDECEKIVERLTKVGPPSKPTTGSEWAGQALEDNCNIAKELLTKLRERRGIKTFPSCTDNVTIESVAIPSADIYLRVSDKDPGSKEW